jgi:hypothetical protein
MADLSMFNIPDPNQIQARVQQQRQAAWSSGNTIAMNQATFANGLEAIFGNPEVNRAKAVQKVISDVEGSLQPQEGETAIETEMRRLHAVREAVSDVDPSIANQVNTRILQLGQIKLEQDKLFADEARANRKEGREIGEYSMTMAEKAQNYQQKAAEGQNYWRRGKNGIERMNVPLNDNITRMQLREGGWVEGAGPNTEAEATDALTTKSQSDLQAQIGKADEGLAAIASTVTQWKPEFSTLPTQLLMKGNNLKEFLTGSPISPDVAARASQYEHWRSNTTDAVNRYINMITGSAMGVEEAKRIISTMPSADDGATAYVSKSRSAVQRLLQIRKRAATALASGLQLSTADIDKMPLPTVSPEEVDAFGAQFGLPPSASLVEREAPAPTRVPMVEGNLNSRIDQILNGGR